MKKKYLVLSFIIPFFCLFLVFITNGIIFGNDSIFYGDSQYQYYQLLIYLKGVIDGTSNLIYSFQVGFGSSMIATLAYYLSSPFNLLLSIFSYENIEIFFIVSVIIRIGLCATTMYLYLNYQDNSRYSLIFSICYSLSFYVVANYYQIMWLDSYFLAPLLLLGIDKLIKEKKLLLYGIILFLIILTNYYMGYMCALFSVLYFAYKFMIQEKKDMRIVKMFLIISILSGLTTMFIHIPNLLQIISIGRNNFRQYLFNIDILGTLSKLYLGSNVENGALNEYHPYLYIGLINVILLLFYFINKSIPKREKILSFFIIFILLLSVIFVPLNNFWHALSSPIGYNFRYMYLFNIFIISICYKAFLNIKDIDKKWYYISFLLFLILSILIIIRDIMNVLYVYISVFFVCTYLILLNQKDRDSKILFVVLIISELFFNSYTVIHVYKLTNRDYINGVYDEKINSLSLIDDESFYRMEFNKKFAFNDALHYGYYGVTGWLSSTNINEEFYNKIGYYSSNNTGFYNESIVLDSLFAIKYYESLYKNNYYDLIYTNRVSALSGYLYGISYTNSYIYENPYALSLGYMVSSNVKQEFVCNDGFDCQNVMMNNMIGYNNNVYTIETIKDNIININSSEDFYILIKDDSDIYNPFNICIDDNCMNLIATSNRSIFIENKYNIGDKVDIKISDNHVVDDIYIAYIDFDSFKDNYNLLKNNQLNITTFKENYISGTIIVDESEVLFLSIPYSDNFKIKVDGEVVDYYKLFDNFIGLNLSIGNHEIEIQYEIKGLILGIIISLISLILFIIYIIFQRKFINRINDVVK